MSYCTGTSKAIVNYKFPGGNQDVYVNTNPPIDVSVTALNTTTITSQSYNFTFNGNALNTNYPFTCNAPIAVPNDADIYLISGTWDDYGGVGSYNTGYGIVMDYSGGGVKIGTGQSVSGYVFNVLAVDCYARFTLEWRYQEAYKLEVLKDGTVIYSDQGQNQPQYTVACDDQCPIGQIRISTIEYPGYKCREKCPPETCCECDCGDVICCYGANGQVLKTILK
jgi:hypothetical protein